MTDWPPEYDTGTICGLVLVFGLPLTLLIPDFSIWDVVPKIRVYRFHAFSQYVTWELLNGGIVAIILILFCLFLEFRKRKLDDTVNAVLNLNQATEKIIGIEKEKQKDAVRACTQLLESNVEHYEHLMLLSEELHHNTQRPPTIEPSDSIIGG